ncbi:hypothetical protein MRB53_034009 [Persea americana]|uniref:Uncharacterized protein n=1 Tax=Persea americana TaxID=3435 RepID=A0ACC2KWA8_PERAE|nr:hypothetical protein MRB53_034009 [Persea americana]|eukprot:TRINITY_DN58565_c0_g1_i1.p1 TRINITY_DN58565_c0_g1~~TRINITY_DN58565_c0_g1_i1.p1  ORF type:complete len:333 (+),score=58.22 TRINITY_DN58565_c0_g1_i1:247-1245(+)
MDKEPEELQFLGIVGIYRESYKILSSYKKLFSHITLSLILPLSFIFLSHIKISDLIFSDIDHDVDALESTPDNSPSQNRLLHRIASEWLSFLLFKAAYLLLVLLFALLSTSAVVYTIASIYTGKDLTFSKILAVVPKVWKRLVITFFWTFVILLCYNTVTGITIFLILVFTGSNAFGITLSILIFAFYFVGFVYISLVWHLASVVSVLEDSYGISAMQKSRDLIRGKVWVSAAVFLQLNLVFIAIHIMFSVMVVHGMRVGIVGKIGYGVLFLVLLAGFMLIGLVVQTVIYLVCKSYHHENIDKSILADHLEVYLGEYVPLNGKAVQMESLSV